MPVSNNKLKTIAAIDFVYGFACMIEEQVQDNSDGLISMAEELKIVSLSALQVVGCDHVTKNQEERMIRMAEEAVQHGFKKTVVEGAAWSAFLMSRLEALLFIPKRKNGTPQKTGWIKDKQIREAIQEVLDLVIGIHLIFDPDYSDDESAGLGVAAGAVYATC